MDEGFLHDTIRKHLPSGANLLHVVGFNFPEGVSEEQQAEVLNQCALLKERCGGEAAGIKSFFVQKNADPRKGYTWVEVAVFESAEAFARFRDHPEHSTFAEKIAKIADVWIVLDVAIEPAVLNPAF